MESEEDKICSNIEESSEVNKIMQDIKELSKNPLKKISNIIDINAKKNRKVRKKLDYSSMEV